MVIKTDAIVLSLQKHNDKARILHAYTRAGGRAQYILYGHKIHPTPLSIIELSYTNQPTRSMQTISNIALTYSEKEMDIKRTCVKLFVAEMISITLTHPMEDALMYEFLEATIHDIDNCSDPEDSHLRFMIGLSMRLGLGEPEIEIPHSRLDRQIALQKLCAHFIEHIDGFIPPKSLDILTEVFD